MNTIERIQQFIAQQRKYASFFEWFRREKDIKEIGIVQSLLEAMPNGPLSKLVNLRASENDPPDCIAENENGSIIGFEVRELVDQEAIEQNQRGNEVYRDWKPPEVVEEIQKIIEEKDKKTFLGGPYEKLVLVIHTAEPVLNIKDLKPTLETHVFRKTEQLNEVYLIFQYDPGSKSYPYLQLKSC